MADEQQEGVASGSKPWSDVNVFLPPDTAGPSRRYIGSFSY